MAGHPHLTKQQLDEAQAPDLALYINAVPDGHVRSGDRQPVSMRLVFLDLDRSIKAVLNAVRHGTSLPKQFFVPDLWHVAKGRACSFPSGDGDKLWDIGCFANSLGVTLYEKVLVDSKNNHPGNFYQKRRPQPDYAEEP